MTKDKKIKNLIDEHIYIIWFFSYIACLIALIIIAYKSKPTIISCKNIINYLKYELCNLCTIVPVVMAVLLHVVPTKKITKLNKGVGSVSVFIMFTLANAIATFKESAGIFAVVIFATYCISFVILIFASGKNISIQEQMERIRLNAIVGKYNKNILSVQLFEVEDSQVGEYEKYTFKYVDSTYRDDNDINAMLSVTYLIKHEYAEDMRFVLNAYQRLVDDGDDYSKELLINSIKNNKNKILEELKKIPSANQVTKEHCCMARLIIQYLTLENRLIDANSAGILTPNGVLELDSEIEKKLFTYCRTGILGVMFVGEDDIYSFNYWKDGAKAGRKYSAFPLKLENKRMFVMIVLKESENKQCSKDIVDAVRKIEKKIKNSFSCQKAVRTC
ncbi:hypothetical protein SAMN02910358_01744 [Lachnospiraceae bacterium XBB1006]|nr:hypothetical protein SAMN02910358_01744 [Lachnospiraceae bacterium XBB1006]